MTIPNTSAKCSRSSANSAIESFHRRGIYAVLRILSGTRAMTALRGALALLLVFVVLGRALDLTVTNYLVENSLTALLIGGAVIFQPELRRALDRLGRTGLRGWFGSAKYEDVIDSVVKAAGRMSHERHGGLFVLERETGLQDVIDTGIRVDAKVSPELLAGIFYPNSPLHDMASSCVRSACRRWLRAAAGDRVPLTIAHLARATAPPSASRRLLMRFRCRQRRDGDIV